MKTILEYYNINEAFKSNLARIIKQDIETSQWAKKTYSAKSLNFKNMINSLCMSNVAWSKITDEEFVKENDSEMINKLVRAVKAGKSEFRYDRTYIPIKDHNIIIFGYQGDKLCYIYNTYTEELKDMVRAETYDQPRVIADYLNECDTFYVLYLGQNDTSKLKSDRFFSKQDSIPTLDKYDRIRKHDLQGVLGQVAGGVDTSKIRWGEHGAYEQFCNNLIEKTKKRYKEIIAKAKFDRSADTTKVDNLVRECTEMYFKALQESIKNPNKYDYSTLSKLHQLIQGEAKSSGSGSHTHGYVSGGLLKNYNSYIEAVRKLTEGTSYNDMYVKQRDDAEKYIEAVYKKLKEIV